MVLARWLLVLAVVAGCKQSLFDAHGDTDGGGTGGDGAISATCPMPCVADAGGDFDGTPGGKGGHWRYLDDHRDRTWAAMTAQGTTFVGSNPGTTITSCASKNAEVCGQLPGALLFSTAGLSAPADPAIEFTADANRTIELQLGVRAPAGAPPQTVRLYRNSREDVLFTGTTDGTTLSHTITVDAIAGDRFLVALAGGLAGQADVGVQLFVVGSPMTFPTECQVAVPFGALTSGMVDNVCGGDFTAQLDSTGTPMPALGPGPFTEAGQAAQIAQHNYYDSANSLDRPGDVTVQLWIKHQMLVDSVTGAWAFSDLDLNSANGGGIGIVIYDNSGVLSIDTQTCTDGNALTFDDVNTPYPTDQKWHFVRVVHHKDMQLEVCIDGAYQGAKTLAGTLKSTLPPYIGKNVVWTPTDASFIGQIDDVRVLNTALPCK